MASKAPFQATHAQLLNWAHRLTPAEAIREKVDNAATWKNEWNAKALTFLQKSWKLHSPTVGMYFSCSKTVKAKVWGMHSFALLAAAGKTQTRQVLVGVEEEGQGLTFDNLAALVSIGPSDPEAEKKYSMLSTGNNLASAALGEGTLVFSREKLTGMAGAHQSLFLWVMP